MNEYEEKRTSQTAYSQNRTFQSRDLSHQPQGTYRAEYIPQNRTAINRENRTVSGPRSRAAAEGRRRPDGTGAGNRPGAGYRLGRLQPRDPAV